jgi:hypothetical protein
MFVSEGGVWNCFDYSPSLTLFEDALFLCPLSPEKSTSERPPCGEAQNVGVLGERGLKLHNF